MDDLGWRAKSSTLPRQPKKIEGLREDFGLRAKSALENMKTEAATGTTEKGGRGKLDVLQNRGVEERAKKDFEQLETEDFKETKRLASLERKAQLYDKLQRGVNLEDEEANELHEVDFIGKALKGDAYWQGQNLHQPEVVVAHKRSLNLRELYPEEIVMRQQAAKKQMQGGSDRDYSTFEVDEAEMEARFRKVDELNEMNAERAEEFGAAKQKALEREAKKKKDSLKQRDAILQKLLQKKQTLRERQRT